MKRVREKERVKHDKGKGALPGQRERERAPWRERESSCFDD